MSSFEDRPHNEIRRTLVKLKCGRCLRPLVTLNRQAGGVVWANGSVSPGGGNRFKSTVSMDLSTESSSIKCVCGRHYVFNQARLKDAYSAAIDEGTKILFALSDRISRVPESVYP